MPGRTSVNDSSGMVDRRHRTSQVGRNVFAVSVTKSQRNSNDSPILSLTDKSQPKESAPGEMGLSREKQKSSHLQ